MLIRKALIVLVLASPAVAAALEVTFVVNDAFVKDRMLSGVAKGASGCRSRS